MQRIPVNDLSRDEPPLRAEIAQALERVAASGWYLQGPEQEGFEAEFAAFIGVAHCVGVANGTDAIELALRGLGCAPGDEVVTAANAGMYTTTAALSAGLVPRYADVDPETLCLSAATVEAVLTPRTRAVVATHLYGRLADVEEIVALCGSRSIAVVEDCAQAAGASRAGVRAGAFGDVATFSFYPTKNLGAIGDAGAVVTDAPDLAARVRALSQYGWESKYRVALPGGMNSRMDELQAAVLRTRLPHLDSWNTRRRDIVHRYAGALGTGGERMVATDSAAFVAHLAVMLTPRRAEVRRRLAAAGVATDIHYPIPDHRQPVWNGAQDQVTLPVTESIVDELVTLPCFPGLTDAEVERVCEVLRDA